MACIKGAVLLLQTTIILQLTIGSLSIYHLEAMDAPVPATVAGSITFELQDGTKIEAPKSLLPLLQTLQLLHEDCGVNDIIPVLQIDGTNMELLVKAAGFVANYPTDLEKGQRIGRMINDLSSHTQVLSSPYEKRLELLRAAHYLGFKILSEVLLENLAKDSVDQSDHLKNIETLSAKEQQERWDKVRKLVPGESPWQKELARQYVLINRRNLPESFIASKNYSFSLAELIDAERIDLNERIDAQGRLDLARLRLQSLERLEDSRFLGLWQRIKYLELSNNKLSSLPQGIFLGRTNLRGLDLSNNELSSIQPGAFRGLTNLRDLDLSGNKLSSLQPSIFMSMTELVDLQLYDNELSSIQPGIFSKLPKLRYLFLSDNELSSIQPGVFRGLTNLIQLELNKNKLTSLEPGIFSDLTNLLYLVISSNKLSSLKPGIFSGLSNLKELELENNELSSLEPVILSGLPKLRKLTISGNPLSEGQVEELRDAYPPFSDN